MKQMSEEEKIEKARKEDRKLPGKYQNAEFILNNLDIMQMKPIDCKTELTEVVERRCYDYLETCINNNMKPSVAGIALAIGVGRETFLRYVNGNVDMPRQNREVLQRYYTLLNALMEDYMQNGKINPVSGLFLLKNNFGYKDTQEFVVNNNLQEETSPETLIEEANLLFEKDGKMANIE